ncbi:MAG: 39S ribosomal protein L45 [Deltaproteobacteria bacterium]|jgi:predicted lipid-binding transport protein (Tim44 family)|nr:39S ribosomal protein L45 [Deltaproteobacteria bacterium]
MHLRLIVFFAVLLTGILALGAWDADAARFGGGKSFGGGSYMNKPAAPPSPAPGMNRAAPGQNAPGAAGAMAGPRMGGMGGMFGGLLAGTLLGSLLFGGGFHGGGFMDILLIGLLIYCGFKLYSRFRRTATVSDGPIQYSSYEPQQEQRGGMDWGQLRGQPQGTTIDAPAGASIPADFDVEEFLRGAKMAYTRLQASWDKRDMDDIAQFASQAVMKEVRAQVEADPNPSTTELLLINAQLLAVVKEGDTERASVFFDVLLREDPKVQATAQVREVWHFMRDGGESWKLDGIQQVEG